MSTDSLLKDLKATHPSNVAKDNNDLSRVRARVKNESAIPIHASVNLVICYR